MKMRPINKPVQTIRSGYSIPLIKNRMNESRFFFCSIFLAVLLISAPALSIPTLANVDLSLLKNTIVAYNLENQKMSLSDGSYRGEEGILGLRPEVGRSLGIKVFIDKNYLRAKDLYKQADKHFKRAVKGMMTQGMMRSLAYHVRMIAEAGVLYNRSIQSAQKRLTVYRSAITPQVDDRLNKKLCSELLEKLLRECLKRASLNLRDGLGYFYNRCQGMDSENGSLTKVNVQFVNHVFRKFMEKSSYELKRRFDLDRCNGSNVVNMGSAWKRVVRNAGFRHISFLETVFEKHKKAEYSVDPLLFVALIKRESNFNPSAVSYVGAAGLNQIMPKTARDLGMKKIFMPPYFKKAKSLFKQERRLKNSALALVADITEENKLAIARQAREFMQKSLYCKIKRIKLYSLYKQELLSKAIDERLDPLKAIEHGYRYFLKMMEIQKGDISLALASYNAGPHRIRQYGGIPPYPETVNFRNNVLIFYRDFLRRLKTCLATTPAS